MSRMFERRQARRVAAASVASSQAPEPGHVLDPSASTVPIAYEATRPTGGITLTPFPGTNRVTSTTTAISSEISRETTEFAPLCVADETHQLDQQVLPEKHQQELIQEENSLRAEPLNDRLPSSSVDTAPEVDQSDLEEAVRSLRIASHDPAPAPATVASAAAPLATDGGSSSLEKAMGSLLIGSAQQVTPVVSGDTPPTTIPAASNADSTELAQAMNCLDIRGRDKEKEKGKDISSVDSGGDYGLFYFDVSGDSGLRQEQKILNLRASRSNQRKELYAALEKGIDEVLEADDFDFESWPDRKYFSDEPCKVDSSNRRWTDKKRRRFLDGLQEVPEGYGIFKAQCETWSIFCQSRLNLSPRKEFASSDKLGRDLARIFWPWYRDHAATEQWKHIQERLTGLFDVAKSLRMAIGEHEREDDCMVSFEYPNVRDPRVDRTARVAAHLQSGRSFKVKPAMNLTDNGKGSTVIEAAGLIVLGDVEPEHGWECEDDNSEHPDEENDLRLMS